MLLKDYKNFNNIDKIVYKITNTVNNKCYIGITNDLSNRIKDHIRFSINDYHIKSYIHKAIKKYGVENFTVDILENCSSDKELNEKEVYYINFHNSFDSKNGYNLTMGGERELPNEETIKKKILSSNKVKVAQYDLDGNLLATFNSVKEAGRELNISDSDIHRCHKNSKSRNGFMFKKYNEIPEFKISPYRSNIAEVVRNLRLGKKASNCVKCKLINKVTNEIVEASSIEELADKVKLHTTTLHKIYKNKTNKKWTLLKEVN